MKATMKNSQTTNIKKTAHQLIDQLPDGCSWTDAIYVMMVRREIELGMEYSDTAHASAIEEVRIDYGLDE